jgi:hypothetical protein
LEQQEMVELDQLLAVAVTKQQLLLMQETLLELLLLEI